MTRRRLDVTIVAGWLLGVFVVASQVSACATTVSPASPGSSDTPGGVANATVPRPLAPLSTSLVSSRRPTLRWRRASGASEVELEMCRDRAMTRNCVAPQFTTADRARPREGLAPGVWFWRLYGVFSGRRVTGPSPVWQFEVGLRDAPVDTSWGSTFDVNGDGYADLVVGAPGASSSSQRTLGTANIFLGGPSGLRDAPDRVLEGGPAEGSFGISVASAGDVNGDGYADLIVGAGGARSGGLLDAGTANVYLGGPGGPSATPVRVFGGRAELERFGWSVASAGDVNGDGYADLLIGAIGADSGGHREVGAVSLYLGGPTGPSAMPVRVLEGATRLAEFGYTVASARDINRDGYADLVIGAPGMGPPGRFGSGATSVYLGGPMGPDATPVRVIEGRNMGDGCGFSAASAGDINGDGFIDLVVACPFADTPGQVVGGRVEVYHGSPQGLSATPTNTYQSAASQDSFGASVHL